MSDEQHKGEEPEVEGHSKRAVHDEPAAEGDDNEVEAHMRRANVRLDLPKKA